MRYFLCLCMYVCMWVLEYYKKRYQQINWKKKKREFSSIEFFVDVYFFPFFLFLYWNRLFKNRGGKNCSHIFEILTSGLLFNFMYIAIILCRQEYGELSFHLFQFLSFCKYFLVYLFLYHLHKFHFISTISYRFVLFINFLSWFSFFSLTSDDSTAPLTITACTCVSVCVFVCVLFFFVFFYIIIFFYLYTVRSCIVLYTLYTIFVFFLIFFLLLPFFISFLLFFWRILQRTINQNAIKMSFYRFSFSFLNTDFSVLCRWKCMT